MVKRCSYGLCNTDDRYPERLEGDIKFVPFPKPKSNIEKCLKWIKICGRPHKQLNPSKINSNRYVCTKHFINKMWPTAEFPDPIPADTFTPSKPPRKRKFATLEDHTDNKDLLMPVEKDKDSQQESQTESQWIEPMDFLSLVMENESMKRDISKMSLDQVDMERQLQESKENCKSLTKKKTVSFSVENISEDVKLMKYYTGFTTDTFNVIFKFLVPNTSISCPLTYIGKGNLSDINNLSLQNQVFLTLCKLRNNCDLQDLGYRFGISQQVTGVIFNSWLNYMFLRFGEISIWPHRDVLYNNMPDGYKEEFPNTFPIVDCTEIRIQKPSSLKAQSQTYSDYKSTNTLKALVAVDPRGSVIFSSMLFAGCMSDKEIFKKSGFQTTVKNLVEIGFLKEGDGLMADKGFDIEKEVEETGLKLNIPPFARSGVQMTQHDVFLTKKIAKHRVHVERAIRRIKSFKILSGRISLSMMSSIDQIWYVCSVLTNFMPLCIKKK